MTLFILLGTMFLALMCAWWLLERGRSRRLRRRGPVDWGDISSKEFCEETDRLAIELVVHTIAQCYGIAENQVYPDDDINVDYSYPAFWCVFLFDDPDALIIDTLSERIEQEYPRWEPSRRVARVRDIINDVSRHLKTGGMPKP